MSASAPLLAGFLVAAFAALVAIAAAFLALRDRRRLRDLQTDLLDSRRRADHADQARDSFFDLATHELRSPLAAILGYQELIAEGAYGPIPDGAAEAIERIGRSGQHLLHLIEGVVELSRLRAGNVQPDVQVVDLAPLLSGIADAFRTHARDRNLDVLIHLPDPPGSLTTDAGRLLRALDLLITSAVKHPGDDPLALRVTRPDDALHVVISGTDIDTRSDQDDATLRLGIRLAIAAGLARVLGGELTTTMDDHERIREIRFSARSLRTTAGFDGPDRSR